MIGDSNRLAHAAALAVAEMPAQAYNPLFLCGPPGVGKTHLLSSIANLLVAHDPGLTVRLTTGEAFTSAFLAALAGGRTDAFKARFEVTIETVTTMEENVTFKLPRELREAPAL